MPSTLLGHAGGGTERVDIGLADGRIASLSPAVPGPGRDLDGGLVLPAFADIHTHLDKGHIWPRKPNPDGSFMGAIEAVGEDRERHWTGPDIARRMDFALRCAYAHGTAAIRTHIDSGPPQGSVSWPVLADMRERWRGRIELQAVALVGPDILIDRKALSEAAKVAKDFGGLLGGAIAVHPESALAMRNAVEIAGEFGLDLDLHCDETLDPAARSLLHLAEAVTATGFAGKVLAGHCCALSVQDHATQQRTIDAVAEAKLAVVSLPMCNLYLQDRASDRTPVRRGVTLLRELHAAGVPVAMSSDNTRDPFYAYGDLDPLEVLREGVRILHLEHPANMAWSWAGALGREAAAIAGFAHTARLEIGAPADLVLFRARSWNELLSRPQSDRQVLRAGVAIDTTLPDYRELDDLMEA